MHVRNYGNKSLPLLAIWVSALPALFFNLFSDFQVARRANIFMGFFKNLRRAMGLDPSADSSSEVEGIDATVTPLRRRNLALNSYDERTSDRLELSGDSVSVHSGVGPARDADKEPMAPAMESRPDSTAIFTQVVAIFNASLPDFLRNSVDPDRERQVLFNALDGDLRKYFDDLEKNVERRMGARFETNRRRLQERLDQLEAKVKKEEEENSNAKNQQLSAERQKRALSERVHDLEKQLADLQAENEQYILENKSMANKLRIVSMNGGELPTADQLADAEANGARIKDLEEEVSRLKGVEVELAKMKEMEADLAKMKEMEAELAKMKEMEAEVAKLTEALAQARTKDELSRAMVNDLNSRAANARREASEKIEEADALRQQLDQASEQLVETSEKLAETTEQLAETSEQLASANSRLNKAQEDLKVVREVQQQVEQLEFNQRNADAEMRRMKDELMEKDELLRQKDSDLLNKNTTLRMKDEAIRRLEDQTDSLRRSIENVQYEKTQTESALRGEIERLKSIKGIPADDIAIPTTARVVAGGELSDGAEDELDTIPDLKLELQTAEDADAAKPRRGRGRPPKARDNQSQKVVEKPQNDASDDFSELDNTDWLVSEPPADYKNKRQRKSAKGDDDSFGYHEPVRQDPPDNPAQMLLW